MKQTAIVIDPSKINTVTEWLEYQKIPFFFERDTTGSGDLTIIIPRRFKEGLLEVIHATV